MNFQLPSGLFDKPVDYRFQRLVVSCDCDSADCGFRQRRAAFLLIMDLGPEHDVTWWYSRN